MGEKTLSFLRGGYMYSVDGQRHQLDSGLYWESKAVSATSAWYLNFHSARLYPQYTDYKGFGYSIRCVVQP